MGGCGHKAPLLPAVEAGVGATAALLIGRRGLWKTQKYRSVQNNIML